MNLTSLRCLKMEPLDILDTQEKMINAREELEEATEKAFEENRIAGIKTLEQAHSYTFD